MLVCCDDGLTNRAWNKAGEGFILGSSICNRAGSTLKEAHNTHRLPTVAKRPSENVPWWLEIIKLPKPTEVV